MRHAPVRNARRSVTGHTPAFASPSGPSTLAPIRTSPFGFGPHFMKLSPSDRIVILTGAGISKESGLDTFRCADGIWARVRLEDVATPEAFERDPDLVHRFYNDRRRGLLDPAIQPNAAHAAL